MGTTKAIMAPATFSLFNEQEMQLTFETGDYKVTVDTQHPRAISPAFPEASDTHFNLTFGDLPTLYLELLSSDTATTIGVVNLNGWTYQKEGDVSFFTYLQSLMGLEITLSEQHDPPAIGILIVGTTDAGDPPLSLTSEKQINPEQVIALSSFTLQHPQGSHAFVFKSGDVKKILLPAESSITAGPFDEATEVPFNLSYAGFPTLFLKLTESDTTNTIEPVQLNGWRYDSESTYSIGDRVSGLRQFTITLLPEISEPPTIGILIVGTTDADPAEN